jgi:hypothetical protein
MVKIVFLGYVRMSLPLYIVEHASCACISCSEVVITCDFESHILSSNLGRRTFFACQNEARFMGSNSTQTPNLVSECCCRATLSLPKPQLHLYIFASCLLRILSCMLRWQFTF